MRYLFSIVALASVVHAQATSPVEAPAPAAVSASEASETRTVEHDGQVFTLANSTVNRNVATDEYTVSGEKIGTWTQLLTVQRLSLGQPTDADAFVTYFKQRVVADGAGLDVLAGGRTASVFSVHFPKSDQNEEQVMVCLAMVEPTKPAQLNIVQYAIKPLRFPVETTAMRLKSWCDKFIAQAHAITGQ